MEMSNMAYLNETSSVKTIVPGAEVSGFCDVVARQKINEVSGEVPQLRSGEGIGISTVDGNTVITNKISAGSNISLVYDMETNTYRIDSTGGSVEGQYVPLSATNCGIGNSNNVQDSAYALGEHNTSRTASLVHGYWNTAHKYSLVQGYWNNASSHSLAQGYAGSAFDSSIAQGTNNRASDGSISQGFANSASNYSFSQGKFNSANSHSFANGESTYAENDSLAQGKFSEARYYSLSQGNGNKAGSYSLSQGYFNTAIDYSMAQGYKNYASNYSFAEGYINTANQYSQAFGYGILVSGKIALDGIRITGTSGIMGIGNWNRTSSDAAFVVGNGINSAKRSDAFIINYDGSVSAAGKISANGVELGAGGGTSFPITGTNGTTAYTYGADCSSFYLSNTVGRAGSVVTFSNNALNFEAYPSTDVSASWYNIINGANNRSNCYCIRFTNDLTSVSLENYSAYDKVTVVHSNQYKPNCVLHWNGYTKVFPSGVYCEMVKGTNDQNQTDWFFTNSGRINNLEWDN